MNKKLEKLFDELDNVHSDMRKDLKIMNEDIDAIRRMLPRRDDTDWNLAEKKGTLRDVPRVEVVIIEEVKKCRDLILKDLEEHLVTAWTRHTIYKRFGEL